MNTVLIRGQTVASTDFTMRLRVHGFDNRLNWDLLTEALNRTFHLTFRILERDEDMDGNPTCMLESGTGCGYYATILPGDAK